MPGHPGPSSSPGRQPRPQPQQDTPARLLPIRFQANATTAAVSCRGNTNRVTNFVVAAITALCFNCLLGGVALALSMRSHSLLASGDRRDAEGQPGRAAADRRRAVIYGRLAGALSCLGVVGTMLGLIWLFSQPNVARLAALVASLDLDGQKADRAGSAMQNRLEMFGRQH